MQLLKLWIGNFMFSRSKHNSILKSCILLVILFTKLYSQEFTNQYALELNPNLSNEWWSKYNNYGQELSEITLNYSGSFKVKRANYNFRVFANKDNIYVGESFVQSQLFNNT